VSLFGKTDPKVPSTISDAQARSLALRAAKSPWFTPKATARRKASEVQRRKSRWS
jgi:hypothetical protein